MTLRRFIDAYLLKMCWISRLGRFAPVPMIASILVWGIAAMDWWNNGEETVRALTPVAGALSIFLESLYLLTLVFRASRLWLALRDQAASEVLRWFLPALNVLTGAIIFAGLFYYFSQQAIEASTGLALCRLLWGLSVGGLLVGLSFGEVLVRFLNATEQVLKLKGPITTRSRSMIARKSGPAA